MGVTREVTTDGNGDKPKTGEIVYVHYTGELLSGHKFDSSRDRCKPFSFKIGQGQVIKAWDEGICQMQVGEKCKLTCSPDYGYGKKGFPPVIPPNSTLVFYIELLGIDTVEEAKAAAIALKEYQRANNDLN